MKSRLRLLHRRLATAVLLCGSAIVPACDGAGISTAFSGSPRLSVENRTTSTIHDVELKRGQESLRFEAIPASAARTSQVAPGDRELVYEVHWRDADGVRHIGKFQVYQIADPLKDVRLQVLSGNRVRLLNGNEFLNETHKTTPPQRG